LGQNEHPKVRVLRQGLMKKRVAGNRRGPGQGGLCLEEGVAR